MGRSSRALVSSWYRARLKWVYRQRMASRYQCNMHTVRLKSAVDYGFSVGGRVVVVVVVVDI